MNILFVSSEFPLRKNQSTGGIGTYLLTLTYHLVKQGYKVTVITQNTGRSQHKNINVVFTDFGKGSFSNLKNKLPFLFLRRILDFLEYPLLFSFSVFLKIKEIEKKEKIDIIEGNDFGGELFFYLFLSRKRLPIVIRLHTPSFIIQRFNQEPPRLFYKILKFLEIFCLKKVDSLYSPTKSLARLISKEVGRPVHTIIPYPFKPLYQKSYVKRKENMVLYVGKLQAKKGVFLLTKSIPQVINKLPNTLFYFVGPDTLQNGVSVHSLLHKELKKLGVLENVYFLNDVAKRELYRLYQQATVVVIPSLWENFPNVCLEAMSQRLPVVSFNTGGLKEIINHRQNGLLVPNYKIDLLSQTIAKLLSDKKLRLKISRRAKEDVKRLCDIQDISKKTIEFYSKNANIIIGNNETK